MLSQFENTEAYSFGLGALRDILSDILTQQNNEGIEETYIARYMLSDGADAI